MPLALVEFEIWGRYSGLVYGCSEAGVDLSICFVSLLDVESHTDSNHDQGEATEDEAADEADVSSGG